MIGYTFSMADNPNRLSEAAAMLGRIGGKIGGPKGGRARAKKLSAERRREIARKAAEARWAKNEHSKRPSPELRSPGGVKER